MKNLFIPSVAIAAAAAFAACSDEVPDNNDNSTQQPDDSLSEQYYSGGELGTAFVSTSKAYEQPAPAVINSDMFLSFNRGEKMFEKPFTANNNGG